MKLISEAIYTDSIYNKIVELHCHFVTILGKYGQPKKDAPVLMKEITNVCAYQLIYLA